MSVRRAVLDILSALSNLASILYLLDYGGFRVSSSALPTNSLYLGIAVIAVFACTAWLLYEGVRAFRAQNQALTGEIFGEKENRFLLGGTICFRARYRGNLKNGFFTTKIRPPELHNIPDTAREYEWLVDYNTNDPNTDTGTLNGPGSGWLRKSHESTWGHKIPFRYSPGKYTATLMVYDGVRGRSAPISTVPLTFTILDEDLLPLHGWTAQGELIPKARSMFVKKPRRRSWLGTLQ